MWNLFCEKKFKTFSQSNFPEQCAVCLNFVFFTVSILWHERIIYVEYDIFQQLGISVERYYLIVNDEPSREIWKLMLTRTLAGGSCRLLRLPPEDRMNLLKGHSADGPPLVKPEELPHK